MVSCPKVRLIWEYLEVTLSPEVYECDWSSSNIMSNEVTRKDNHGINVIAAAVKTHVFQQKCLGHCPNITSAKGMLKNMYQIDIWNASQDSTVNKCHEFWSPANIIVDLSCK